MHRVITGLNQKAIRVFIIATMKDAQQRKHINGLIMVPTTYAVHVMPAMRLCGSIVMKMQISTNAPYAESQDHITWSMRIQTDTGVQFANTGKDIF